jgi:hypothetical protein
MRFAATPTATFETAPAGNHVAICNGIVDLGVQPGRGKYPDPKPMVYLRFELPTERIKYEKDGKEIEGPMSIGRDFSAFMSEKANLRKFVESWFGKKFPSDAAAAEFDFKTLLGRKCLLNVTHTEKNGKTYANIQNATPIPKGMQTDYQQHNKAIFFDLTAPEQAAFDALPQWLQKRIDERIIEKPKANDKAPDYDELNPPPFDEDIPF